MKKNLVGLGGVFAAVGAGAAYYFHTLPMRSKRRSWAYRSRIRRTMIPCTWPCP